MVGVLTTLKNCSYPILANRRASSQWGVWVLMASGVLWLSEGRKLLRRHSNRLAHVPMGP
jgi:hypothetical protein